MLLRSVPYFQFLFVLSLRSQQVQMQNMIKRGKIKQTFLTCLNQEKDNL